MTTAKALAIVAGVTTCHKQFKPLHTDCIDAHTYRVTFAVVSVDPRTVCKWFTDAGAYAYRIGTDVPAGEMYVYFKELPDMP